MISYDEALSIVTEAARPLESEDLALQFAYGRVLAGPVVAQVDSPSSDVSAMDGYAIRDASLAIASRFRVVGSSYPGVGFADPLGEGECVRIFTGAPLPPEADRVVIQEDVRREADEITIGTLLTSAKRYVRQRGMDFRQGDHLLEAGCFLDPRALVAAAGADLSMLRVWRRPRVTIIVTGDELIEPGRSRDTPGSIPESISLGLAAFAQSWGAEVIARRRLRDDVALMELAAAAALDESDIIVVVGGASVGEKDFAKRSFSAHGTEILFSRVAMMPGKPVWFGRKEARLILGLPGNPTSAMVTARLFLAPLLAGMSGRPSSLALRWEKKRLTGPLASTGDRETFVRAKYSGDGVCPLENQDSGMQLSLAQADVLIRRLPNLPAADVRTDVEVLNF